MEKQRKKSLGINAVMSGLNIGVSLVFPLITLPYISRILGVENLGKYNFSNTFCSFFILFATLGINTYGIRECAKVCDDKEKTSILVSQIFSINLLTTIFSYAILFTLLFFSKTLQVYKECILIFSTGVIFTVIGVEWVYKAYEEFTYITIRNIIFKLISVVLLFIFVRNDNDYLTYAIITVFSTCGAYFFNFIYSRKYCHIRLTKNINWQQHLVPLITLSGSAIAVHIYNSSDTLMLGFLSNDYYVGIYSISSKIYIMAKSILLALLSVSIPRLSMYIEKNSDVFFEHLIQHIINAMNFFALPIMTGIFCLSNEIIIILAGKTYIKAEISLKILCIAIICSMFAWISSECVLIPAKQERESFISTGIAAVINILLNFILIPIWNANAAALTTVIAELFVMIYCTIKANQITNIKFINKNMLKTIIGCIGIIFVCTILRYLISSFILRVFFSVLVSIIIYGIINISLKNSFALEIINKVSNIAKKSMENSL